MPHLSLIFSPVLEGKRKRCSADLAQSYQESSSLPSSGVESEGEADKGTHRKRKRHTRSKRLKMKRKYADMALSDHR